MKEYFSNLYLYNYWANTQMIDVFLKQHLVPEKSLSWMSHITVAEIDWYSRITKEDIGDYDLWTSIPIEELKVLYQQIDQKFISLCNKTSDFDEIVSYKNTKGIAHKSKLSDILIHVANHGTYHRGQIAANLKENGIQPISTDFITWKRDIYQK